MRIETFSSRNFRNLASEVISFSPGVNILVGDNGQGKTNILEAIQLFKFGRSFRTGRDGEMIRFGEEFCRVDAAILLQNGERDDYSAVFERNGSKRVKVSGKEIAKYSDLVGKYPCVLFGPQDVDLVGGAPVERRRFIDMAGCMAERTYLDILRDYRRVLQQRNAVLKQGRKAAERKIWDEELIAKGCALSEKRRSVVAALEKHVGRYDGALEAPFGFRLRYKPGFLDESMQVDDAAEAFSMKLSAMEDEEIRRGVTLVGPHRDDVKMLLHGKELKKYGSQGQKRLMALLLKLAEMAHLEEQLSERCVLLLDDVFSEFDNKIGSELKRLLGDDRQIFVTSPVALGWHDAHSSRIFCVSNGHISL